MRSRRGENKGMGMGVVLVRERDGNGGGKVVINLMGWGFVDGIL
jgi:hypothetical protein